MGKTIREKLAEKHGQPAPSTTRRTHTAGCTCKGRGTVPLYDPVTRRIATVACPR